MVRPNKHDPLWLCEINNAVYPKQLRLAVKIFWATALCTRVIKKRFAHSTVNIASILSVSAFMYGTMG